MKKIICMALCFASLAALSLTPAVALAASNRQTAAVSADAAVFQAVRVTGVTLSQTSLTLTQGKAFKLTATVKPSNATNKKVTWKSGNTAIATVSSTGTVKGIKAGSTYIYVYAADGNKSAKCKVTVKEPVNTYGNTPGNITNGGLAARQGDWIYYSNINDHSYLYKVKTDGTGRTRLCSDRVWGINVVGDWVYYSVASGLYKIRTSGKGRTKLSHMDTQGGPWAINVTGGWVYYCCLIGDERQTAVYRVRTDGTGQTKLQDAFATGIIVAGSFIYYTHVDGDGLYKMHTDGTGKTKLSGICGENINVADGFIYYVAYHPSAGYSIDKIRTDGTGQTKLYKGYCTKINVSGGFIYYTGTESDGLYRMRTDGTGKTKLCSDSVTSINIVGSWIYYELWAGRSKYALYKIKTNGTGRQIVK